MDKFPVSHRSHIMKAVKSSGNLSTELKLIRIFRNLKIKGWRRNSKLFGKPDFIFPKLKIVIFVDGCFWHGHICRKLKPQTNIEYWDSKISKNIKRDKLVTRKLKKSGWTVVRIWECQIKKSTLPIKFQNIFKK